MNPSLPYALPPSPLCRILRFFFFFVELLLRGGADATREKQLKATPSSGPDHAARRRAVEVTPVAIGGRAARGGTLGYLYYTYTTEAGRPFWAALVRVRSKGSAPSVCYVDVFVGGIRRAEGGVLVGCQVAGQVASFDCPVMSLLYVKGVKPFKMVWLVCVQTPLYRLMKSNDPP